MIQPPSIILTGQHHLYDQKLFNADIHFPSGKWTCLLGRSGVGKSTVLRIMLGLETGGRFIGAIETSDDIPLHGRISYMAQSDLLLPWLSVVENICIGARLRGDAPDMVRAQTLLKRVGLSGHSSKKPSALSGGMRQRVALARTLFENRPVVFLDEPFSALDAGTRAEMQELSAEVLSDRTVVLVTHDPAEASRMAHQIIIMTADGTDIWPVPYTDPLRELHDPQTLDCQTHLLALLRKQPS